MLRAEPGTSFKIGGVEYTICGQCWATKCVLSLPLLRLPTDWLQVPADQWGPAGWRCSRCLLEPKRWTTLRVRLHEADTALRIGADNPVIGPLRAGLVQGRPVGEWVLLLIEAGDSERRLVGGFVCTKGARLLFFPVLPVWVAEASDPHGTPLANVDHLTLEARKGGRFRSHFTFSDHAKPLLGPSIRPASSSMLPWFSLLVHELGAFPLAPGVLEIRFPFPRPDFHSQVGDLIGRTGPPCVVPICEVAGDPNYVQVDVWVAWPDAGSLRQGEPLPWPETAAVREAPASQLLKFARNDLWLPAEGIRVSVVVSRPAGRLERPRFLLPQRDQASHRIP